MSRLPARAEFARADPPTDLRGARFAAGVTAVVALGVLITSSEALFAAQAVVFALGALLGVRYSPYQSLYRAWFAGLFSRPPLTGSPQAYRFAQGIGLALALTGSLGYLLGAEPIGAASAALVLLGASVNAVTGFRIGAELYVLITKLAHRPST